jgi:hypothetical protein
VTILNQLKRIGKLSQCSRCEGLFEVIEEQFVLYCSRFCEKEHDLFKAAGKEESVLSDPVKTYFLTPEELKAYREKKTSHVKKKEKHVRDWRWLQNRRENKKGQA